MRKIFKIDVPPVPFAQATRKTEWDLGNGLDSLGLFLGFDWDCDWTTNWVSLKFIEILTGIYLLWPVYLFTTVVPRTDTVTRSRYT